MFNHHHQATFIPHHVRSSFIHSFALELPLLLLASRSIMCKRKISTDEKYITMEREVAHSRSRTEQICARTFVVVAICELRSLAVAAVCRVHSTKPGKTTSRVESFVSFHSLHIHFSFHPPSGSVRGVARFLRSTKTDTKSSSSLVLNVLMSLSVHVDGKM